MLKNSLFLLMLQIFLLNFNCCSAQYQFQKDGLKQTNQYRAKHQVPLLKLDNDLNSRATKCSAFYARGNKPHTCIEAKDYGENISGGSSSRGAPSFAAETKRGIQAWYDEIKYYNYKKPDPDNYKKTGHFTQLVWKNSRQLGLSCATNPKSKWTYCVSLYKPPGNFASVAAYKNNVLPPKP